MAQKTQDQAGTDTQSGLGIGQGTADAVNHGGKRYPAPGVGLRVEKDLGMTHVLGKRPLQIGPGQVVEVLHFNKCVGAGIINIEKILEVGKPVSRLHFFNRGIGQFDTVASGYGKHQLRLQRTLDMQVQLCLRQGGDKRSQVVVFPDREAGG